MGESIRHEILTTGGSSVKEWDKSYLIDPVELGVAAQSSEIYGAINLKQLEALGETLEHGFSELRSLRQQVVQQGEEIQAIKVKSDISMVIGIIGAATATGAMIYAVRTHKKISLVQDDLSRLTWLELQKEATRSERIAKVRETLQQS